jgi:hypothetical protein
VICDKQLVFRLMQETVGGLESQAQKVEDVPCRIKPRFAYPSSQSIYSAVGLDGMIVSHVVTRASRIQSTPSETRGAEKASQYVGKTSLDPAKLGS